MVKAIVVMLALAGYANAKGGHGGHHTVHHGTHPHLTHNPVHSIGR